MFFKRYGTRTTSHHQSEICNFFLDEDSPVENSVVLVVIGWIVYLLNEVDSSILQSMETKPFWQKRSTLGALLPSAFTTGIPNTFRALVHTIQLQ